MKKLLLVISAIMLGTSIVVADGSSSSSSVNTEIVLSNSRVANNISSKGSKSPKKKIAIYVLDNHILVAEALIGSYCKIISDGNLVFSDIVSNCDIEVEDNLSGVCQFYFSNDSSSYYAEYEF